VECSSSTSTITASVLIYGHWIVTLLFLHIKYTVWKTLKKLLFLLYGKHSLSTSLQLFVLPILVKVFFLMAGLKNSVSVMIFLSFQFSAAETWVWPICLYSLSIFKTLLFSTAAKETIFFCYVQYYSLRKFSFSNNLYIFITHLLCIFNSYGNFSL
jgi:hypothetical protein